MKRSQLLFVITAVVFLLGIVMFVMNIVKAKPVALINPTEISNFREAGALVLERLREEVKGAKVFVLGIHPLIIDGESVWNGFVVRGEVDGILKTGLIAAHNGLKNLPAFLGGERKIFYWPEDQAKLVEWSKPFPQSVFITTSFQSHPRVKEGLFSAFPNDPNVLFITQAPLYASPEELAAVGKKCKYRSTEPTDLLYCASEQASLKFFRKKLDPNKHWIVMERHGMHNVVVFLR